MKNLKNLEFLRFFWHLLLFVCMVKIYSGSILWIFQSIINR